MSTIYQKLSGEQQKQVNEFLARGDQMLFTVFPEFNDEELKTDVTQMREKYVAVVKKHEQLFPRLESKQREDIVKTIIQCAAVKHRIEEEAVESAKYAFDPCETERINCIASVSAEAAIMHLNCTVLDLSIFGGIVCHGAAIVYQITAGNNCNLAAKRCRQNSH
jgi:hypothetical protein